MDFISVKVTAVLWSVSERRVLMLCDSKRSEGVLRFGRSWMIPKDAKKPEDLWLRKTDDQKV